MGPALIGLGVFGIIAAIVFALWAGLKGKTPATAATPATTTALATDPVKRTVLQVAVQLERAGMQIAADKLKSIWSGNKADLLQTALVEAEHLAQGGPMAVVSDLESMFAKTLTAKLADSTEAQKVLDTIVDELGADHPLLADFAKSLLPAKQPGAPAPALAGSTAGK